MKPQTKRSLCLGSFLVIVTVVVLYSYCNGNSVCYTFPFLSGLDRDRLGTKSQAEVVVASVIVQTKRPLEMTTPLKKQKGSIYETSRILGDLHTKNKKEEDDGKTVNVTVEKVEKVEKLHFYQNRTIHHTHLMTGVEEQHNDTRAEKTHDFKKHVLPPSDIVGKIAEEILRKANVSEEEANRELMRAEKVDEYVDREREQSRRMKQHEHSLLEKLKESRSTGGKSKEKTLVRVERVDLTDEEEEDEVPAQEKPVKHDKPVKQEEHVNKEKPVEASYEARFQKRAASSNTGIKRFTVEKKSNKTLMSENKKSSYERRFGKTNKINNTLNNTSAVKKGDTVPDSKSNETTETITITPPPFFAKFLKITEKEREMMDFLHNYTESNGTLFGRVLNITQERNGTKNKELDMVQVRADAAHLREKRDDKEGNFRDTLKPLIDKLFGSNNGTKDLKESFNLSDILGKLTSGRASQNFPATDNKQTSSLDSRALLVKFLQQGDRSRSGTPKNDTSAHTDDAYIKVIGTKLESDTSEQQSRLNLKKTLLELANHIDLTRQDNDSRTTSPEIQEKKSDLTILSLLLNQSTWEDLRDFNLSRALKEITGSSLKVKRHEKLEDLGSGQTHARVKIIRPEADKLAGTRRPELVFNAVRKPSNLSKSEEGLTSSKYLTNATSIEKHASVSSGSGSGELGDGGYRSVDFESQNSKTLRAVEKSETNKQSKHGSNGLLKFGAIRCDALDPKLLLYNRIFKTGSSTTEFIITNSSSRMHYHYKIGTTEDWYDKPKSHPYPGLIIRKANNLKKYPRMAFVAHFYFRRKLNLPQAHTYINQVRDPVRRLVSHYHYMRSNLRPAYRIKEFRASGEQGESLEKCFRLQHKGCQNNVMTRFFCGKHSYCRRGNGRALRKAMGNIKRYYAAVGLLENYDVYLQILNKRLPKFFPKISRKDIGKFKYNSEYRFDDISKDLIRDITRANWADVKLYHFLKTRFWQQAKVCGITTKLNQEQVY